MKSLSEIAKEAPLNEDQLQTIETKLLQNGNLSQERIRQQIEAVFCRIGLDDYYLTTTPLAEIARLIETIRAAEIISELDQKKEVDIDLRSEHQSNAIYVSSDIHEKAVKIERRIEERYPFHRIHSYRTMGTSLETHLRIVLVSDPEFAHRHVREDAGDLSRLFGNKFLEEKTEETRQRYENFIRNAGKKEVYIEFGERTRSNETRLMVLSHSSGVKRLFSAISDVINYYGIYTNVKYFEPLANGKVAMSFYFNQVEDSGVLQNIEEDISLAFVLPENRLSPLFRAAQLSAQEMCYGMAAANFAHQFLTGYSGEYQALVEVLDDQPELKGTLEALRYNLVKEAYTLERVLEAIKQNPPVFKSIYEHFESKLLPNLDARNTDLLRKAAEERICQQVEIDMDRQILRFLLVFNDAILKTNFYFACKRSLAFRLLPDFLEPPEYPEKPYGVFYILGAEFKGFHVRFRDVARGGIRIIRSTDQENYEGNSDAIFDENYNLAGTQQFKNKDIPEGGSKGAMLLHLNAQDHPEEAFQKYIDGILDLILPNDALVDYYDREEILFLGPDEGTAELMDWAAVRAKERGYKFWKSFSTGKSLEKGGIPHDVYGMTTNSVHQYALKIMEKLGLEESRMTKVQTGGPDGDLGSNEILISKDRTIAIVDGSGVIYDPEGLDRGELVRLATKRQMIHAFDRSKFSPGGYMVLVSDHNVTLPDGKIVQDGTSFRNSFHLLKEIRADFFIPCGGRPKSIHIGNWTDMLDDRGQVRFKYIVEGANLFITQDARLRLEERSAIIFKDASANKGGVTSSSLEVFSSLALTDRQFEEWMCVEDGRDPEFREKYVRQVLDIIRQNAVNEFELIWRENKASGIKKSILTDRISQKINFLTDRIQESDLYENQNLRRKVLSMHAPPILLEWLGIENVIQNLPDIYLRAAFASHLASCYVYRYGLESNEISFFNYIQELDRQ